MIKRNGRHDEGEAVARPGVELLDVGSNAREVIDRIGRDLAPVATLARLATDAADRASNPRSVDGWRAGARLADEMARRFLAAFTVTGSPSGAARAAGCSQFDHYCWLGLIVGHKPMPGYSEAFALAREQANYFLEEHARERATIGHDGRKPSDTLLIMLLKAEMPEKYLERSLNRHEHTGPGGGPIQVADVTELPDSALELIAARGAHRLLGMIDATATVVEDAEEIGSDE